MGQKKNSLDQLQLQATVNGLTSNVSTEMMHQNLTVKGSSQVRREGVTGGVQSSKKSLDISEGSKLRLDKSVKLHELSR